MLRKPTSAVLTDWENFFVQIIQLIFRLEIFFLFIHDLATESRRHANKVTQFKIFFAEKKLSFGKIYIFGRERRSLDQSKWISTKGFSAYVSYLQNDTGKTRQSSKFRQIFFISLPKCLFPSICPPPQLLKLKILKIVKLQVLPRF